LIRYRWILFELGDALIDFVMQHSLNST